MKSGSVVALLVLVVVIVAGMISLARTPGSGTPGVITPVTTPETSPSEGPTGSQGPADLQAKDNVNAGKNQRATVPPNEAELSSGTLQVSAVDAITGQPVSRFWMKPDALADLASAGPPLLSDETSHIVELSHTQWDGDVARFLVSSPRHTPKSVELTRPRRIGQQIKLELVRAASIVGTVRDGASSPLASARVTLKYHGPSSEYTGESSEPMPLPDAYQGATLRLTDATGAYAFSQLPSGVYRTHVDHGSAQHTSDPIFVRSGEWSLGDHWLDEHVRLTVTVLQADGTAAVDTRVLLVEATAPLNASLGDEVEITANRYTDAEGRATLGPLSLGEYGVYVQSDDGTAPPMALEVTEASRSMLQLSAQLELVEER